MSNQPQRPPQHHPQNPFRTQPRPGVNPNPNTNTNPKRNFLERKPAKFTSIPMSYANLLPYLLSNQMAMVSPGKVYQPPFPRWYNPYTTCAYHGGVLGHFVEQCVSFKHKVQILIDVGWLTFQEDSPNVRTNPLSNHGSSTVNAVEECKSHELKQIRDVSTPKRFILEALREAGVIKCDAKTPAPLPYKSDKVVPWKYGIQGPNEGQDASVICVGNGMPAAKVTNISGMSGMTRSGHIFALPELPARSKDKGKAKADMGEREKTGLTVNDEASAEKFTKEGDDLNKKEISAEEATEFLRIIQQSEFKVIEQLNNTPAKISLLWQLMHSEPHRALLVKILNEAHVAQDISVEGFGGIVNNINTNNYLTFADEEMSVEGKGQNKALHVSIKCMGHIVAKVLIDNDSSLNAMPKTTSDKLSLRLSSMVVRAFDGSRCDVRGEIDLLIHIGPHTCQITFQVMDISPAYSCFLGRPWIHSVGVVPSTLHQKLKFVVEGQLVIVRVSIAKRGFSALSVKKESRRAPELKQRAKREISSLSESSVSC
ncbi:hypothetical protein GmHk_14G041726 [Glycine max]|nr:hypothetical protein GmHk_14G041726 [Glycine max]